MSAAPSNSIINEAADQISHFISDSYCKNISFQEWLTAAIKNNSEMLSRIAIELAIGCLAAFLVYLISYTAKKFFHYIRRMYKERRTSVKLWGLSDITKCVVCVASQQKIFIGKKYKRTRRTKTAKQRPIRYAVGEGQLVALPHIISSLQNGYGNKFKWENFTHANTALAQATLDSSKGYDLIHVGGPKASSIAKKLIDVYLRWKFGIIKYDRKKKRFLLIIKYNLKGVIYNAANDNFSPIKRGKKIYKGGLSDFNAPLASADRIKKDIAIIANFRREGQQKVIILAGWSTYGTGEVARYFCTKLTKCKAWKQRKHNSYIAIVECLFTNHPPIAERSKLTHFIDFDLE